MRAALLLVPILIPGIPAQHTSFGAAIARFEARIAADVAKDGIGSISAAVMVGNRIAWAKGFGWADVERKRPAVATTIYRIGSISKSITAVLMARLAQEGRLKLDAPVVGFLPEIETLQGEDGRAKTVTFRHLATHTSGLIREPRMRGAARGPIANWERKVVASIAKTSFQSVPGKRYSYSNIGYGILGLALGRVAEQPFMAQVRKKIFVPLGMTSSTFILNEEQRTRLAAGYLLRRDTGEGERRADPTQPEKEHAGRGYKVPNGGVYSTVGDLCRFASALTGASKQKILNDALRREMLRVQTPGDKTRGYGLGFSMVTTRPSPH